MELGKAGTSGKNIEMSPLAFFLQQVIFTGPLATIVWLCGLWAGVVRPKLAVARAFPIAMPYETDKPIYVLRGMKMPLPDYWPKVKAYQ
jgi:hypothetical protein